MCVNGLCCITAACWSIAGKQTLAFHLSVTADSRPAGMFWRVWFVVFFFLVEIFAGFDVMLCSAVL